MAATTKNDEPLWRPVLGIKTSMDRYREHVNTRFTQRLQDSAQLHRWTVDRPHDFWIDLYDYLGLQPALPANIHQAYDDAAGGISANPAWFVGHEFNYAENALFSCPDPDAIALIGMQENTSLGTGGEERVTWRQFRERVRITASALRQHGIKQGDRVAALVANSVWAIVLFHATASLGAIFTSVSPELGQEGCVSRFNQVAPSILFVDGDTLWKGKATPTESKMKQILARLSPKPVTYVIPISSPVTQSRTIGHFLKQARPDDPLRFLRVPFNHPLLIAYSSGTTGAPKCMVHHHGIILQFRKMAMVHNGTTPADRILQYSSTSWIVFYIMCGYLASGATLLVYNGSPMYPTADHLLRVAAHHKVTYFGTSPRYLLELEHAGHVPKSMHDLSSLRIVYCTGATLSAEQYRWLYRSFPSHVHLCNTAGGTDTATSHIAGDPSSPIYAGEMQMFALGMDIDVLDPSTGESILATDAAGEMVIKKPFPSMPSFFWGDKDNKKYRESYFTRFPQRNVWAQADWLSRNPVTGGYIMHGRSDGVLNPSGIRFGSGEIYAIVEATPFHAKVRNSLCVGRRRPTDGDEEVFLFLVMHRRGSLDSKLVAELRAAIGKALSPRHVPQFILEVPDIPVTINGKKVETLIKQIISGRDVTPTSTVQNPECLDHFRRFRSLERARL